jgi:hypothetical protein
MFMNQNQNVYLHYCLSHWRNVTDDLFKKNYLLYLPTDGIIFFDYVLNLL